METTYFNTELEDAFAMAPKGLEENEDIWYEGAD